ncbi:hypothetical protein PspLS_00729 [Pyricularia sp. CBS 133598]|nr:hypothetical protein PspLS_00729 [Pyricularia sp. CBS 133598]
MRGAAKAIFERVVADFPEHKNGEGHKDENEHVSSFDQDCEAGKLDNDSSTRTEDKMARRRHRRVMAIIILTFCLLLALIIGVEAYTTAARRG